MPSITDNRKKRGRGRPPTGIGNPVGLRLYPDLEAKIDAWASKQRDKPGRPEAIRRLLEQALAGPYPKSQPSKEAEKNKARKMAGREIDLLGDKSATGEERASRKRRLIRGPGEFRGLRADQPKSKG
jgi:hypothetical protein